jgi:aspartyl-tRNA(Asn)/glutamyl-tRNA(Gln) amidotransferase subunit A
VLDLSVTELSAALAGKQVSSVELTRAFLERIGKLKDLNAFITVDEAGALKQAAQADARRAGGAAGPLTGVPFAYKDIYCTEGLRTTCGSRMLENFVSPYDAHVVEQFTAAGAVALGKCNMDEFAMGSSNENSYFGPVRNPWDRRRVPGGSSGGSAAAVAARLVPAATGTDTGGSVRQPAALCGIVGLKPTYGRVSRHGLIAFASSLDVVGPMTRDVRDAALLLQAIAGHDPHDSTSANVEVPDYLANLEDGVEGLRIGVVPELMVEGVEPGVREVTERVARGLEGAGAEVGEASLPHSGYGLPAYYIINPAEVSSNLARFDGVRYGLRASADGVHEMYRKTREEGFGDEAKRRIMLGTYALSSGYYDAYYAQAQKVRTRIIEDFRAAFSRYDLLLSPTAPSVAFRIGEKVDDPLAMYANDICAVPANLAGIPAISVPGGLSDGLPVGVQLMGDHFTEPVLLRAARAAEQVADFDFAMKP